MKGFTLALLVPVAAAAVFLGGEDGAGMVALMGLFLAGFALLLFRKDASYSRDRAESPGRARDAQFLGFLILSGLLLRVVIAMGIRQAGLNQVIAPDEYTFHDNAQYFLGWLEGDYATPFSYRWRSSTQVGYFVMVGAVYWVVGVYSIVPVLLNCLFGVLCAIPAHRIASRIGGREAGRLAAALVVFFPSLVLWSTLLIRDSLVLLLILWATVHAQTLLRRFSLKTILWLVACLAALATLRSYVFVLLTAGVVVGFLVAAVRRPGRALAAAIVSGLGAVMVVQGLGVGGDALSEASLGALSNRRFLNSLGQSGVELGTHDLSTPVGALTYLPIGLMWFLLAPFPWQAGGRQGLALPDVLVWYVCIPFVVMGIAYGLRRRRRTSMVPLIVAALFTVIHSLVEGNVGIIVRHRAHVLVLFLPFAAVAMVRLRAKMRAARPAAPGWTRSRALQGRSTGETWAARRPVRRGPG